MVQNETRGHQAAGIYYVTWIQFLRFSTMEAPILSHSVLVTTD